MLKNIIRKVFRRCGLHIGNKHKYDQLLKSAAESAQFRDRYAIAVRQLEQLQSATRLGESVCTEPDPNAPITAAREPEWDAEYQVALGAAKQRTGDLDGAEAHYGRAVALKFRFGPACEKLREIANIYWRMALEHRSKGNVVDERIALVKVVELNPNHKEAKDFLASIISRDTRFDVTRQCYIHLDPIRGERVYRETFLRALEYISSGGIIGEILEFGVLGGFTARIACETMRDMLMLRQIHLFDSFQGLPEYTSPVDANSYDIAGRNLWADKMCFPDSFIKDLGEPIDSHIFGRLCDVVSSKRIFVHRGYFSETLTKPLPIKAALIHVDCDLYQSTKEVFSRLYEMDVLQDGCVLLFDDYNCFKASPYYGERRAFREFLNEQERFEASPFFTYGFNGAAFFLHEREGYYHIDTCEVKDRHKEMQGV